MDGIGSGAGAAGLAVEAYNLYSAIRGGRKAKKQLKDLLKRIRLITSPEFFAKTVQAARPLAREIVQAGQGPEAQLHIARAVGKAGAAQTGIGGQLLAASENIPEFQAAGRATDIATGQIGRMLEGLNLESGAASSLADLYRTSAIPMGSASSIAAKLTALLKKTPQIPTTVGTQPYPKVPLPDPFGGIPLPPRDPFAASMVSPSFSGFTPPR